MSYILGISAFYHDSAACLLKNGRIIAAAQEERFTRKKHDPSFPKKAIEFCLKEGRIDIESIPVIVFYEKPFLKFDRIINSIQSNTPFGFSFFRKSIKSWTKTKLWIPVIIKKELAYSGKILFTEHHESHAAGTFFSSPFSESAIVTIDGVGEKACTTIGIGKENQVKIIKEQQYPHSFGLLYSAFTQYCGFKVNSGEYKLMGLAPYGKPVYKDLILKHFVTITDTAEVVLNLKYFSFDKGESTINNAFCDVLGQKARKPSGEMTSFYCDMASSIQSITEDFLLELLKYTKKITQSENICLSGGVALNCKANGELLTKDIFKNMWVQPASGDSGGAIGAAFVGWYHYMKNERNYIDNTLTDQAYLGISYSNEDIENTLKEHRIDYSLVNDEKLCDEVSTQLKDKKIIGWFQGKMEFGPRALGNRSILASPLYSDMKKHVNLRIKKREGFRPFAPIVLEEKAKDWFSDIISSKYMLFTFRSDRKEKIPSCIHEDGTARVQTLSSDENPLLHLLISSFEQKTSCPVLINTSFNVRGEPIVASPLDALKCFFQTEMDILVLGNYIIQKENNNNVDEILSKQIEYELD
ncbi:carbamoyltransferase N-terminal domain-containing protein [uncultured Aquimarina sp.]|uniref:carbamoyltransferase family protein n=1 Tax=uncultured Aquimarina sp. TaxID=575652 RepID=UPI00260DCE14|nr:carbamoyltransferase N-terminal domain-containing protein [uncultured Aquimarina sp.]